MGEYKIGDIVDIDGIRYVVKEEIETRSCKGCEYNKRLNGCDLSIIDCRNMGCILKKAQEKEVEKQPLDLTKILDGCPIGTKFYSVIFGDVEFVKILTEKVCFMCKDRTIEPVYKNGLYHNYYEGECIVFPAKDQRDWSKFVRFWDHPKKERFDPKTLHPFDAVIVRLEDQTFWSIDFFSFVETKNVKCIGGYFNRCIPYNDETKRLVGTTEEAPEYYRYWED